MLTKQKWKSAEAKQQAAELEESWTAITKRHTPKKPAVKRNLTRQPVMVSNPRVAEMRAIKSVDSGTTGAVKCKGEDKVYTGDKVIGIAVMHKSNAVPIFSDEAAKDVSKMRR